MAHYMCLSRVCKHMQYLQGKHMSNVCAITYIEKKNAIIRNLLVIVVSKLHIILKHIHIEKSSGTIIENNITGNSIFTIYVLTYYVSWLQGENISVLAADWYLAYHVFSTRPFCHPMLMLFSFYIFYFLFLMGGARCTLHYFINIASKQVVLDPMNHLLSQNRYLCDTNELIFSEHVIFWLKKKNLICLNVDPTTLTATIIEYH